MKRVKVVILSGLTYPSAIELLYENSVMMFESKCKERDIDCERFQFFFGNNGPKIRGAITG
jgi:hypothetical protein